MFALLWRIDDACHWLSRWHLLPRFAFRPLCDWCDRRLLASAPDDFYVEDEPLEDVLTAFNRGEKHLTEKTRREIAYRYRDEVVEGSGRAIEPWRRNVPRPIGFGCQHMSMTAGNGVITEAKGLCGCDMQPIYATASR